MIDPPANLPLFFLQRFNLGLLVLYPVAWWAPLARAGFMPLFGGNEISILTGVAALWQTDIVLCAIVVLFAIIAPYAKTLALALLHFDYLPRRYLPVIGYLGKLSMADVFLIAFYVVIVKGVGVGYVEIAWGLYFFTALVLISLGLAWASERMGKG
ncbi:MAG: paraquat-inducible membrane protein A [Alphaproteobacteria bacterium]|nr:MAG: paraquat-inducible membrane protein A [Alphaproteobacteria bacterium]